MNFSKVKRKRKKKKKIGMGIRPDVFDHIIHSLCKSLTLDLLHSEYNRVLLQIHKDTHLQMVWD